MFKVYGTLQVVKLGITAADIKGFEVQAAKHNPGLKLVAGEDKIKCGFCGQEHPAKLFFWAKFLGYDFPNGNGDAIPRKYAADFGPSFINRHLDVNHETSPQNVIGRIETTWHVEEPIKLPLHAGTGLDAPTIGDVIRMYNIENPITGELQVEGVCMVDRTTALGDDIACKLISGVLNSVSQEASTEYCECSVCTHRMHNPTEPICAHVMPGSLMIKSYEVEDKELLTAAKAELDLALTARDIKAAETAQEKMAKARRNVLAYKIHHNPVGGGLAVVTVPAYDKGKVRDLVADMKTGKASVQAVAAVIAEQEAVYGQQPHLLEAVKEINEFMGFKMNAQAEAALKKLNGVEAVQILSAFQGVVAGGPNDPSLPVNDAKQKKPVSAPKRMPEAVDNAVSSLDTVMPVDTDSKITAWHKAVATLNLLGALNNAEQTLRVRHGSLDNLVLAAGAGRGTPAFTGAAEGVRGLAALAQPVSQVTAQLCDALGREANEILSSVSPEEMTAALAYLDKTMKTADAEDVRARQEDAIKDVNRCLRADRIQHDLFEHIVGRLGRSYGEAWVTPEIYLVANMEAEIQRLSQERDDAWKAFTDARTAWIADGRKTGKPAEAVTALYAKAMQLFEQVNTLEQKQRESAPGLKEVPQDVKKAVGEVQPFMEGCLRAALELPAVKMSVKAMEDDEVAFGAILSQGGTADDFLRLKIKHGLADGSLNTVDIATELKAAKTDDLADLKAFRDFAATFKVTSKPVAGDREYWAVYLITPEGGYREQPGEYASEAEARDAAVKMGTTNLNEYGVGKVSHKSRQAGAPVVAALPAGTPSFISVKEARKRLQEEAGLAPDSAEDVITEWTKLHPGSQVVKAKTALNFKAGDQYMSDTDIAKEFEGMKVVEFKMNKSGKSGVIVMEFPAAGESVGGGKEPGDEVIENFVIYDDGRIGFDNWYPEAVSNQIKKVIEEKTGVVSAKVDAVFFPTADRRKGYWAIEADGVVVHRARVADLCGNRFVQTVVSGGQHVVMDVLGHVTSEAYRADLLAHASREGLDAVIRQLELASKLTAAGDFYPKPLGDGKWKDSNGNSYDTVQEAAEAEAHVYMDPKADPESPEYKSEHVAKVKDLIRSANARAQAARNEAEGLGEYPKPLASGRWQDSNGNSYTTRRQAAAAERAMMAYQTNVVMSLVRHGKTTVDFVASADNKAFLVAYVYDRKGKPLGSHSYDSLAAVETSGFPQAIKSRLLAALEARVKETSMAHVLQCPLCNYTTNVKGDMTKHKAEKHGKIKAGDTGWVDQDNKPVAPEDVPKARKMAKERREAMESLDKELAETDAMPVAQALSTAVGGDKPEHIGEWRYSDKNDSAVFTVHSEERSIPVRVLVAVFEDGTVTISPFQGGKPMGSDRYGTSEMDTYEGLGNQNFQDGSEQAVAEMVDDVKYWLGVVDKYAASWETDEDVEAGINPNWHRHIKAIHDVGAGLHAVKPVDAMADAVLASLENRLERVQTLPKGFQGLQIDAATAWNMVDAGIRPQDFKGVRHRSRRMAACLAFADLLHPVIVNELSLAAKTDFHAVLTQLQASGHPEPLAIAHFLRRHGVVFGQHYTGKLALSALLKPLAVRAEGLGPKPELRVEQQAAKKITTYEEVVTEESSQEGSYDEELSGAEEVYLFDPEGDDDPSGVQWAIDKLKAIGVMEYSDSAPKEFEHGWYTTEAQQDQHTGNYTSYSAHLDGFSADEQKQIWAGVLGKKPGKPEPEVEPEPPMAAQKHGFMRVMVTGELRPLADVAAVTLIDDHMQLLDSNFKPVIKAFTPASSAEHGAFVALVSAVADELDMQGQAEHESEFEDIKADFPMSGSELTETIPATFEAAGVDLKPFVDKIVAQAQTAIDDINTQLGGKTTVEQLGEEFGDKVYSDIVLQAMGHGVALTDDPNVAAKLKELGFDNVHTTVHLDDFASDAAWSALTAYHNVRNTGGEPVKAALVVAKAQEVVREITEDVFQNATPDLRAHMIASGFVVDDTSVSRLVRDFGIYAAQWPHTCAPDAVKTTLQALANSPAYGGTAPVLGEVEMRLRALETWLDRMALTAWSGEDEVDTVPEDSTFQVGQGVKSRIGEVGRVVEEEIGGKVGVVFGDSPDETVEMVEVADLEPFEVPAGEHESGTHGLATVSSLQAEAQDEAGPGSVVQNLHQGKPGAAAAGAVVTYDNAKAVCEQVKTGIEAPFVSCSYSTLGNDETRDVTTVLVLISLQPKAEWANGYVENSDYCRFSLTHDGKLEEFMKVKWGGKRFRRTVVKTVEDAIAKMNAFVQQGGGGPKKGKPAFEVVDEAELKEAGKDRTEENRAALETMKKHGNRTGLVQSNLRAAATVTYEVEWQGQRLPADLDPEDASVGIFGDGWMFGDEGLWMDDKGMVHGEDGSELGKGKLFVDGEEHPLPDTGVAAAAKPKTTGPAQTVMHDVATKEDAEKLLADGGIAWDHATPERDFITYRDKDKRAVAWYSGFNKRLSLWDAPKAKPSSLELERQGKLPVEDTLPEAEHVMAAKTAEALREELKEIKRQRDRLDSRDTSGLKTPEANEKFHQRYLRLNEREAKANKALKALEASSLNQAGTQVIAGFFQAPGHVITAGDKTSSGKTRPANLYYRPPNISATIDVSGDTTEFLQEFRANIDKLMSEFGNLLDADERDLLTEHLGIVDTELEKRGNAAPAATGDKCPTCGQEKCGCPLKKPQKAREEYDQEQLAVGIAIELEHTGDPEVAAGIAMNHLDENPDYYKHMKPGGEAGEEQLVKAAKTGHAVELAQKLSDGLGGGEATAVQDPQSSFGPQATQASVEVDEFVLTVTCDPSHDGAQVAIRLASKAKPSEVWAVTTYHDEAELPAMQADLEHDMTAMAESETGDNPELSHAEMKEWGGRQVGARLRSRGARTLLGFGEVDEFAEMVNNASEQELIEFVEAVEGTYVRDEHEEGVDTYELRDAGEEALRDAILHHDRERFESHADELEAIIGQAVTAGKRPKG